MDQSFTFYSEFISKILVVEAFFFCFSDLGTEIWVFVMPSEKPYTKLENEISRFSWHRVEGKPRSNVKKNVSEAQFYSEIIIVF